MAEHEKPAFAEPARVREWLVFTNYDGHDNESMSHEDFLRNRKEILRSPGIFELLLEIKGEFLMWRWLGGADHKDLIITYVRVKGEPT